jgi:uncharacterized protein (TIGR02145 family)
VALAAQNGVTISGLSIDAGTVTFNVSWSLQAMQDLTPPLTLWSDTVWVFVDYNKAGKMERLPLRTGATLTDTSAPGVGKVMEETGNNQGVWVVGNARSASAFSATVQLFTTVTDVGGACVYGSNYPPVGEYISDTEISFTGTPMYNLVLAHNDGSTTVTVQSGGTFLLPCDYTLQSFTDATGAPGIMKCIPMAGSIDFTNPAVSKNQQASFVVNSEPAVPNPALVTYRWSAPDFSPATYEGRTYTFTTPGTPGIYPVTLTAQSENYCPLAITKEVEVVDCTAPGATVNFTAFNPCSNAATGATWTLQDTREPNNNQNYKVKKMADGRIWMVQDLKFGDKCNKTSFSGSNGKDQQGRVSSIFPLYYGDCSSNRIQGGGYYYDWAAAINKSGAYYGAPSTVGCSGTGSSANACQGICPDGWHIPTGGQSGEVAILANATGFCISASVCWLTGSNFEGVASGHLHYDGTLYWTDLMMLHVATDCSGNSMWEVRLKNASWEQSCYGGGERFQGEVVRCVRNY